MRRGPAASAADGQAAVEFTLVFPMVILLVVGMIAGSFMFFQSSGLTNGARAASRWATVESSLNSGAGLCESGSPNTIVSEVTKAANIVQVNQGKLCAKNGNSTTELVQPTYIPNKANIVVDAFPDLTNPECITVNITYTAPPLAPPFPPILMQAHSSTPTTRATAATTCPAPTKAS
ncbi:MAG: hypothetical protein QOK05_2818 [Chloroflexota bacterium]|jgi:Flp pilus assembly protein TadG|nr:hypothetical protein [Chloroflexota bacterium]